MGNASHQNLYRYNLQCHYSICSQKNDLNFFIWRIIYRLGLNVINTSPVSLAVSLSSKVRSSFFMVKI